MKNDYYLVGARIESVGVMPGNEVMERGWPTLGPERPAVINLMKPAGRPSKSTGPILKTQKYVNYSLFAMADPEGNSAGMIFGVGRNGNGFYVLGSADDDLAMKGLVILNVRDLTQEELSAQAWDVFPGQEPTAIVLSDGSTLFTSMDPEGNGPGV